MITQICLGIPLDFQYQIGTAEASSLIQLSSYWNPGLSSETQPLLRYSDHFVYTNLISPLLVCIHASHSAPLEDPNTFMIFAMSKSKSNQ